MRRRKLLAGLALTLFILTLAGFFLSLMVGPVRTSASDLWAALRGEGKYQDIFFQLRLPRALLSFLVGASLGLAGAILQGYFRNSLADPFILGSSSGAALGAVLAAELGLKFVFPGFSTQGFMALMTSLALVAVVYLISERRRVRTTENLLLTGIAAGALASAITSFLIFRRPDAYEQAVFWLLGSFSLAGWSQVWVLLPYVLLAVVAGYLLAPQMNVLVLGDEVAASLGCPVKSIRRIFLILSTLLAAFSVSVAGIIGFVGLITPHTVRLLLGPDHRRLFVYSAWAGGVFLLYSDFLARTVFLPSEVPVGVITAAFGAPFFIYLLNRRRTKEV
ncbi:MAG: FecCD family ABC transporter permease [Candidatus Saccharicenans sp.]